MSLGRDAGVVRRIREIGGYSRRRIVVLDTIDAGAADERIGPGATDQHVVAITAIERATAVEADQDVPSPAEPQIRLAPLSPYRLSS